MEGFKQVPGRHVAVKDDQARCSICGADYGWNTTFRMVVDNMQMSDDCPKCHRLPLHGETKLKSGLLTSDDITWGTF